MAHAWSLLLLPCIAALAAAPAYSQADAADPLDAELLEGLAPAEPLQQAEGEDLGAAENPFLRLSEQMRMVETWLREAQLGGPTQRVQEGIIAELDQLIGQQQKKCQGGKQSNSSNPSDSSSSASASNPKPDSAGSQAAANSTDAMRPGDASKTELGTPQDILKKVWGHLPTRLRDQMLQNPAERFLPKYEREIEDYFERLIELDDPPQDR